MPFPVPLISSGIFFPPKSKRMAKRITTQPQPIWAINGNIAEFIIYVNMLSWPVASVGWITSIIQRAAASQKRINEFLSKKNNITSKKSSKKSIIGDISFQNVSFAYKNLKILEISLTSSRDVPGLPICEVVKQLLTLDGGLQEYILSKWPIGSHIREF